MCLFLFVSIYFYTSEVYILIISSYLALIPDLSVTTTLRPSVASCRAARTSFLWFVQTERLKQFLLKRLNVNSPNLYSDQNCNVVEGEKSHGSLLRPQFSSVWVEQHRDNQTLTFARASWLSEELQVFQGGWIQNVFLAGGGGCCCFCLSPGSFEKLAEALRIVYKRRSF